MANPILKTSPLSLLAVCAAASLALAEPAPTIQSLIDSGEYRQAEKLLRSQLRSADGEEAAAGAEQLEILRRTRLDFSTSETDVLAELRQSIPDVAAADLQKWREAGVLQARVIDGEVLYFHSAAGNLFRLSEEARSRRTSSPPAKKKFDLNAHLRQVVELAEAQGEAAVFPVRHRVRYALTIKEGHPRLKPGALVRAWLPYPQDYRRQHAVRLISAEPADPVMADADAPQRTAYFEQRLDQSGAAPRFAVEFEFETSAYCPDLDPAKVQPYEVDGDLYRQYTSERSPHIVFNDDVKQLAQEIVGDETNPLEKTRLIFRWVSANIPWVSEMEYSIIPSLSAKGLAARCGDCGVQGMTFITLCRAAGVPARWQSGWQTKPGESNMHDWSEFYVEPWGWLPADASYGVREDDDPRVRDFYCGGIDAYRLIVNLDYARPLQPPKKSFRSEPNDFQRGEVEIDGQNLYFDEWSWKFDVETTNLAEPAATNPS